MKYKQKNIILEDLGDYNPLEILRTAGKYYIDLAKSDNPRQQFRKDLKDAGVDDYLQGASAIPFLGIPFGLASIGLNLAAGNTQRAIIQAIITAAATVGVSTAGRGFAVAATNPKVAQAVAIILSKVVDKMGRVPAIGPKIVQVVGSMQGQLKTLLSDLSAAATESQIANAEEESQKVKGALQKLVNSKAAKIISGKEKPANRKDRDRMSIRELYNNTSTNLRERPTVKLSKNSIRKLVKESIKKSGIVLGEAVGKQHGEAGGVTAQRELLLYRNDLIKLAAGESLEIKQSRDMIDSGERIGIKLIGGKATIAVLMKSKKLKITGATFDESVLEIKTDLGTNKAQPKAAEFMSGNSDSIRYESQGNKAVLKIPKEFSNLEGDEEKQVSRSQEVEPIIFAVDFQTVDVAAGGESSFK